MKYEIQEPIEIPRSNRQIDRRRLKEWWNALKLRNGESLGTAIGCYVFSIKSGRGELPWYAGRASGSVFSDECFEHHKLTHYHDALAGYEKGTPFLTLIVKLTPTDRFAKASDKKGAHKDIEYLERHLISLCLGRNPDLKNVRDTKLSRGIVVPGLINSPPGQPSAGVRSFKRLLLGR